MFQRLSCLPYAFYFALVFLKSALVFQRLSCLPYVFYFAIFFLKSALVFQRLSCLPYVFYFALAFLKSALVYQRLSCLPYVFYYALVFLKSVAAFQRLSCLPYTFYFALVSLKSALAFQRLSCLLCVLSSFCLCNVSSTNSIALLRLASSLWLSAVNSAFLFNAKAWPHPQRDRFTCTVVPLYGHTFLKRIIWDIFLTVLAIQHQKNVERLNHRYYTSRNRYSNTDSMIPTL